MTTRWLLLLCLVMAPYGVLMTVGSLWLHDRGYLIPWLVVNAMVMVIGLLIAQKWRGKKAKQPVVGQVKADARWTPAGESAWQDVTKIAARVSDADIPLNDVQQLWSTIYEVLQVVARRFHPKSREPVLEIPVPYILRIMELVAFDLRAAFSAHVPGAHILTLRDFQRMKQLADLSQRLYVVYRVLRFGINPIGAILGEAREAIGDRLTQESTADMKRWAVSYAVQKTGFYAIQLYSGQVILSDVDFESFHSRSTKQQEEFASQRDSTIEAEPLRVLVLGQVKAGKSSLINALFGSTRAGVDVVPRTKNVEPHVLVRDGLQRALILDTAGFGTGSDHENPFDVYREEVLNADLVLIVCSAVSAARGPDRALLNDVREFFQNEPNRIFPPVLVALTHIDQLRPWNEWKPPYDLTDTANPKSRNIAAAIEAVSKDLQIAPEHIIPVCLAEDRIYNVEDGLVPEILHSMTLAQRAKYQRCLRQSFDEAYWSQLWQQAANSGRWLRKALIGS